MMHQCILCCSSDVRPYRQVERSYASKHYQLHLGRCTRCGFVFLLNIPQIEYDEDYLHLEHVVTTQDPLALFRAQARLAQIKRYVTPMPDKRFLDIGIGDGLLLSLIEQSGYSAFGVDINRAGVELARKQYGLQAALHVGPFHNAFPSEKFDVIHMNEVIEHIAEPMTLLRWCREHLAAKGCLVVQTGNLDSLASRLKGGNWDYFRPVHIGYFSTRTLTYAIQQASFRVTRIVTVDWRLLPSLRTATTLGKQEGLIRALRFLFLYLTTIPYGLRRTIVIYST